MIDTFSFVIQQPLFNLQPCWILTKRKSGEGLKMYQGRAGLMNWIYEYLWGIYMYESLLSGIYLYKSLFSGLYTDEALI